MHQLLVKKTWLWPRHTAKQEATKSERLCQALSLRWWRVHALSEVSSLFFASIAFSTHAVASARCTHTGGENGFKTQHCILISKDPTILEFCDLILSGYFTLSLSLSLCCHVGRSLQDPPSCFDHAPGPVVHGASHLASGPLPPKLDTQTSTSHTHKFMQHLQIEGWNGHQDSILASQCLIYWFSIYAKAENMFHVFWPALCKIKAPRLCASVLIVLPAPWMGCSSSTCYAKMKTAKQRNLIVYWFYMILHDFTITFLCFSKHSAMLYNNTFPHLLLGPALDPRKQALQLWVLRAVEQKNTTINK